MLKDESPEKSPVPPSSGANTPPNPPGPGNDKPAKPEKSGKPTLILICAILVVGAIIGFALFKQHLDANKKAAASKATPPIAIVGTVAKHKDVSIYLDGLGTVQAYNTVTVKVRVDGALEKVAFTEGQDVHVGDLLVQIDPAPYKTALEQAIAKKAQDAAQLANAQIDLKREVELFAAKIDSEQVYATQKALVDQLDASVKADQAAIDSAKVQLDYTTVTSPLDGRTGIRLVDQGNIVHATDTNGVVVITQLKPISVIFTLPEQTLVQLHQHGESNMFKVLAVDRDNSTPLDEGALAVIDNQIDTTTGTVRLKANFPNEKLLLWPGQFVNARLLLTVRSNAVVVPAAVIQRGPQGDYAYVIEKNTNRPPGTEDKGNTAVNINSEAKTTNAPSRRGGKGGEGGELAMAKMQTVTDEIIDADAVIDSGLDAGQRVVLEGQYKLQDGSTVRVSMAGNTNKPAAKTNDQADAAP
jgi:multidrug efflux system membrane fusion protein